MRSYKIDGLLKESLIMLFATGIASLCNLLYQLYMVRKLSTIDYGILNSLFSLIMIVSVPTGTFQTVITKFVSSFHGRDELGKIKFLLSKAIRNVSLFAVSLFLILILLSKFISDYLRISSIIPVIIASVIIAFSLFIPISLGALQGLQRFNKMGFIMAIGGMLKLSLGILLVLAGLGVAGALGGFAAAVLFTFVLSTIPIIGFFSHHTPLQEVDMSEVYRYVVPTALTWLAFMSLTNIDIILVKHFFSPQEAGYYSIASMLGKIVLFLPAAITAVMFPKVSNLHGQGKETRPILKMSLIYVALLCGGAALVCILFPEEVMRLVLGRIVSECTLLARIFALNMAFFSLLTILLFYQLSVHRFKFIIPLSIFAVLEVILILLFHNSLFQVLTIMGIIGFLLFLLNLRSAYYVRTC